MFKKSLFKKGFAVILATAFMLVAVGCEKEGNTLNKNSVMKGLPDYSADANEKVVMIGGYVAPVKAGILGDKSYITDEKYVEVKECGLDYVLTLYEQGPTDVDVLKSLECAGKAGVKVMVRWDAISGFSTATVDEMKRGLNGIQDNEAFMGIFAKDEPNSDQFEALGKAREVYSQVTDKYFYVNLYPNYANPDQTGESTYKEYINAYCGKVKNNMIMEDHYPFGFDGVSKYTVSDIFLSNIEILEKYANFYGMEHWEYIQGENVGIGSKTPDYYDFRMQMYCEMCYGVVNMQYFCYFTPFSNVEDSLTAFIDSNGEKTQRWFDGKKINEEIHKFDHVYLNFTDNWTGTMTVIGTENKTGKQKAFDMLNEKIFEHERIKQVTTQQDTIIGTYKDKDGRDGFMMVNYTAPAYRLKDKVEIDFNDADAVIFYREGEYNLVELTDGHFEIELDAGEGVFAIPVKY